MAFSGALEDRLAIRELMETYNDAVNRRDTDQWAGTWADDAVWDLAGQVIEGKGPIVGAWEGAMAGFSYVGFGATPGAIEVDGDTATARFFVRETLVSEDGKIQQLEGRYEDELRKSSSGWVFTKRAYTILRDTAS
ncbi:MAG: nuclear transport factor 2 family protein [Pseudomonadota bacterium]